MSADRIAATEARLATMEATFDDLLADPVANLRELDTAARIIRSLSSTLSTLGRASATKLTPQQRIAQALERAEGDGL